MAQPTDPRGRFEQALRGLISRFGVADGPALATAVRMGVDGMLEALQESDSDGESLSPLDVVRIRANKLLATQLPPRVFRDARQLATLRAEVRCLCEAWLGPEARRGSRFGSSQG
jgi:hypothetical protein